MAQPMAGRAQRAEVWLGAGAPSSDFLTPAAPDPPPAVLRRRYTPLSLALAPARPRRGWGAGHGGRREVGGWGPSPNLDFCPPWSVPCPLRRALPCNEVFISRDD